MIGFGKARLVRRSIEELKYQKKNLRYCLTVTSMTPLALITPNLACAAIAS